MLYKMHEYHHAAMSPMRLAARSVHGLYTNPWVPASYTRMGRSIAASANLFERVTRRYAKPRFGLDYTEVEGRRTWVEETTVYDLPFCDLVHFNRGDRSPDDPRLLLVAPMSGHYATLLRGTVEALLPSHDVYITDWINAKDVGLAEGPFSLDDYVEYLQAFLRFFGPGTHVMAVCQPSVPVLAATALMCADEHPCRPASLVLMGGPIDTRISPTEVNQFAASKPLEWFAKNLIHKVPAGHVGTGRSVYPGFLQLSGFMAMNMDRHVSAHFKYFNNLVAGDGDSAEQHRDFYDEYLSVMDLPAEFYLETIEKVFHQHQLPEGTLVIRNRRVDLSKVRDCGLLTIEGEKDDITGMGQTEAAHRLCTALPEALRKHHLAPKVGHYGIFNGRRWREEIQPLVRAFLREQDHRVHAENRQSPKRLPQALLGDQGAARNDEAGVGELVRRVWQMLLA
ncbi:MAG: polyhydroxyalkanoate depolymerase [Rhodospirillaceae bacterium]